jgi:hypothetical protein
MQIKNLYNSVLFSGYPFFTKIKWKESIKKIVGLPLANKVGEDN